MYISSNRRRLAAESQTKRGTRVLIRSFSVGLSHLDPHPTVRKRGDIRFHPNLFNNLPPLTQRPCSRWLGLRIRVHIQRYILESLDQANDYRRRFVVCELLSKANSWPSVERKKDERVRNEVLLDTFIQEPVRIEFFRCGGLLLLKDLLENRLGRNSPSGPHRSFLRCISQGK